MKKKIKQKKISYYTKKLWELTKQLVRRQYRQPYGWECFTCGKKIKIPSDAHTSHFISSSVCGAFLRYSLDNLRVTCYHCNINLGGNQAYFYRNLVKEKGQAYVDQLFIDKQKIIKADRLWYQTKISEYESLLSVESGVAKAESGEVEEYLEGLLPQE